MKNDKLYYSWVPEWLKLPLILLSLFPHLMLLSLFHSNAEFTSSFLAVEVEHIQFFMALTYAGIVVTLLFFNRIFLFFRLRTYILLMNMASILILILMTQMKDSYMIAVLRVLEGVFGLLEGACLLPLLLAQFKSKNSRIFAYLFLYAFMLTGATFTCSLLKSAIQNYGWTEMVQVVIYFHLLVILIALSILSNQRIQRKYPLYQIDWVGVFFLLIALISGAYVLIFGRKLYWFENAAIRNYTLICFLTGLIFVTRQVLIKRPIFYFEVLKYKNALFGMFLFFMFYLIRSGLNNIYTLMGSAWKWPWELVLQIQYWNVGGTLIGVLLSGLLLCKEVPYMRIFTIGFLLLGIDCLWFVHIIYPDSSIAVLRAPLFLQGIAQGLLFTPIVMFMLSKVDRLHSSHVGILGTSTRFWATNIGFSILQQTNYTFQEKHMTHLQQQLDASNPVVQAAWNRIGSSAAASQTLHAQLSIQAKLLANMEIFTALAYLSFFTILMILLASVLWYCRPQINLIISKLS